MRIARGIDVTGEHRCPSCEATWLCTDPDCEEGLDNTCQRCADQQVTHAVIGAVLTAFGAGIWWLVHGYRALCDGGMGETCMR